MSQIIENQKKLIEFIKDTMCKVEGEEFFIQNVNLYHPLYTFFGDNFYTGSLFVIGNKNYIKILEKSQESLFGPQPEKDDSSTLRFQGRAKKFNINNSDQNIKSVILKYDVRVNLSGEYYYKFKSLTDLKQYYPYLSKIVEASNDVKANNEQVDNLINELSKIIDSNKKDNSKLKSSIILKNDNNYGQKN